MKIDTIYITTDGAVRGNGKEFNLGCWGYLLQHNNKEKLYGEIELNSTNNQMELNSILKALQTINNKEKWSLVVTSDSQYAINCITVWSKNWIKNDWKTKENKPVKNDFYVKEILSTMNKFKDVKFIHVNGHARHPENERVDEYLNELMDKFEKEHKHDFMKG